MYLLPLLAAFTLYQNRSLYDQVMVRPDPNNGYGDYLRAADVVRDGFVDCYARWSPQDLKRTMESKAGAQDAWTDAMEKRLQVVRELHDLDFLSVQRLGSERYSRAVALIRAGNQKNVWDPREKLDPSTLFPELAEFRRLVQVLRMDAYVRFADGDSRGATADLLDGLTFARRIKGSSLINELVGIAVESIVFRTFDEHLNRLSREDAEQISRYCDAALAEPNSYVRALGREREMQLAAIDDLLSAAKPGDFLGTTFGTDQGDSALADYVAHMTPSEKRLARQRFIDKINALYSRFVDNLSQGESKWLEKVPTPPDAPGSVSTPDELADSIVSMFTPVFDQVTASVLRTRACLRLLDVHSRILAYRWKHDKLPAELKDAVPEGLLLDPMSNDAFRYEPHGTAYTLYAKGIAATGRIDLYYKRPPNLPKSDDPIPPALLLGAQ